MKTSNHEPKSKSISPEQIQDGLWWIVASLFQILGFINLFLMPAKIVEPRFKDEFAQGASANAAELQTSVLLTFGFLITGTLIKMYVVQCRTQRDRA